MKKISIGSDHGGFQLKEYLKENLSINYEIIDEGCFSTDSTDYPIFAQKVAKDIETNKADLGIVVCTSGIGVSIVANKVKGVRCALCTSLDMAEKSRLHNDANVLALGKMNQSFEEALEIAKTFLSTEFSNEERHIRRIKEIITIEGENN